MKDEYTVRVAGHTDGNLICDSLDCACGNIAHGLGIHFAATPFGFVVNFDDLEKLYLAAKTYRETHELV
jgi:hypothetical protein